MARSVFVIFIFAINTSVAQDGSLCFEAWLKGNAYGQLLDVQEQKIEGEKTVLFLNTKQEWKSRDDLGRFYLSWDGLEEKYDEVGINVYETLLVKMSQCTGKPLKDLRISVVSPIPILFSLEIKYEYGKVVEDLQYASPRGMSVGLDIEESDLGSLGINGHRTLKKDLESCIKDMENFMKSYFTNRESCKACMVDPRKISHGIYEYWITELEGEITSNYSEQILVKVWYFPVGEKETQISYSLESFFAAGLVSRSAFKDASSEYFKSFTEFKDGFRQELYRRLELGQ